jgi:DNA-binding SARP family transcriptional activator
MIIQGKLRVPRLAEQLVKRPRLRELIAELASSSHVLTLYAAAGAGKTTAVVEALPHVDVPVAWLTVDATDSSSDRLLAYLQAVIGRQVPPAATVASDALRQGIPHAEAGGLLAEAAGSSPLLLVLDALERISPTGGAIDVISALVRYAPATLSIILVSRRELRLDLDTESALGGVAHLPASELRFTIEEAAAALALGGRELEPEKVVEITGGWVAGVLFEAQGNYDGLDAYLATQVLETLEPAEQKFLITTSLLDEVTADAAKALGEAAAAALLAALKGTQLPAAWDRSRRRLRCLPCFRDFLLRQFDRRPETETAPIREALADLLAGQGASASPNSSQMRVRLREFGQPTIEVDGVEVRARIKKSYELLAYLASRPSRAAERDQLLDALFDGRSDESTRSYLRQATHRLREVLPDDVVLAFEGTLLRLNSKLVIASDSEQASELLARAARCPERERLEILVDALALVDRGEYLAGVTSSWVDERRQHFTDLAADARHEAAKLLFSEADYGQAKRFAASVVHTDPYRESTWRLLMKIAKATGDEDGVVEAYRSCEEAMAEIGVNVSATTESLLVTLRS